MKKVYIPIEDVYLMQALRNRINKPQIGSIIWTKNGKPIDISQEVIEEWRLTGLNNCDFITSNAYKGIRYEEASTNE